jgi:hypothetical protein
MKKSFTINLSQQVARVVEVDALAELSVALKSLGLSEGYRRVLVVIGGASKLSEENYHRLQQFFLEVLAPIAQKWQAYVVDGGTDAGVMRLMGEARTAINGTFPLIGVSPVGLVTLPEQASISADAAALEPSHTHFLLVPGSKWGDESAWLARTANELAGDKPTVAILINGGEVTWKDALENIQAGRLVLAIAGSGRTADLLAAGLRGEETDTRIEPLIHSGLLQTIDLADGTDILTSIIDTILVGNE